MPSASTPLARIAPAAFILIWASGYVVAKYAAPHAEPLTFLLMRYVGVIALMACLATWARAPWPSSLTQTAHLAVAGVCIQASYLGCVWVAVYHGMPAGVVALIANLQPVLTAMAGPLVGERVTARQWTGLALGFAGVALVISGKLTTTGMTTSGLMLSLAALMSITAGTLYQKRFCPSFDLRTGQIIQFVASFAVTLPFALVFESFRVEWSAPFAMAMLWSVFVLTGGGISLLFFMIRHGSATRVTSTMYLVPVVTALMAWAMFGESFGGTATVGMAVTLLGVFLVVAR